MFYEFAERSLGLETFSHISGIALEILFNIDSISKTMCMNPTKT